ncbi:ATP-binding protein [Desertimonas flava]|uniref:ATP-binding protein n=1 Tax=Desertimonas flava TaxID=2064846 RepID=UPI0013C51D96|nr:ATP-binding protein [Desertimonas flava]
MRWWWNLPLRRKVSVLVIVPALAMAIPAAYAIALNHRQETTREHAREIQRLRDQGFDLAVDTVVSDIGVLRYVLSEDATDLESLDRLIAGHDAAIAELDEGLGDDLQPAVERVAERLDTYIEASSEVRDAASGPSPVPDRILQQLRVAADEVAREVGDLIAVLEGDLQQARADIDAASRSVLIALVTGMVASLLLSSIALMVFVRNFVKRIREMKELAAHVVAGGDLGDVVPESRDELGVLASELVDAGKLLISANDDIARSRDAALAATREKDEFLSRMSHELRTPLTAILGFGQLLQLEERLHQEDREAIDQIVKAGRHLLALINDLLDISRIATGHLSLSLEPVVVGDVVESVAALLAPQAADRSVMVSSTVDPALAVTADHQRIRQVLLNLVSNAIKYNSTPGTVVVAAERQDSSGTVVVSVTDSGPGISRDGQARLFLPFERLEATSAIEGTGVGLALSKSLVEAMGGSIGVDSVVGRGSRFWVEFQAAEAPAAADHAVPEVESRSVVDHPAATTVLLVEDNLANVRVLERFMRGRDEHLEVAMQGGMAVELARELQPAAVLLDLHLPDINGDEVLAMLKNDPRTAEVPVIVLSADATDGGRRRLLEAGAADYLTKPIDLERLGRVLDGLGATI